MFISVAIATNFENTLFATLLPRPFPSQIYQPTVPTSAEKVVCIVFDDGWKSQLDAVPILDSFGYKATFAIVTSYYSYPDYMNWGDIKGLADKGMDIASHTDTHPDLSAVDYPTLYEELAKSQQILRSRGYAGNVLVYPYGGAADNQTVRDAVTQYYLVARGVEGGKCNMTDFDRYNLPAYDITHDVNLETFTGYLKDTSGDNVIILFYHKIGYENEDTAISEETFQSQMQYLKDNGYTVKTLSELFLAEQPNL